MPKKFKKAGVETSRYGYDDDDSEGRVRVFVRMISKENSTLVRGNITRTYTIDDAKVSEVADAIEKALF